LKSEYFATSSAGRFSKSAPGTLDLEISSANSIRSGLKK
jgi:hypothetical protein